MTFKMHTAQETRDAFNAEGLDFSVHNMGAHFVIRANDRVYDFWPSSGKWRVRGARYTSEGGLRTFLPRVKGHRKGGVPTAKASNPTLGERLAETKRDLEETKTELVAFRNEVDARFAELENKLWSECGYTGQAAENATHLSFPKMKFKPRVRVHADGSFTYPEYYAFDTIKAQFPEPLHVQLCPVRYEEIMAYANAFSPAESETVDRGEVENEQGRVGRWRGSVAASYDPVALHARRLIDIERRFLIKEKTHAKRNENHAAWNKAWREGFNARNVAIADQSAFDIALGRTAR